MGTHGSTILNLNHKFTAAPYQSLHAITDNSTFSPPQFLDQCASNFVVMLHFSQNMVHLSWPRGLLLTTSAQKITRCHPFNQTMQPLPTKKAAKITKQSAVGMLLWLNILLFNWKCSFTNWWVLTIHFHSVQLDLAYYLYDFNSKSCCHREADWGNNNLACIYWLQINIPVDLKMWIEMRQKLHPLLLCALRLSWDWYLVWFIGGLFSRREQHSSYVMIDF